MARTKGYFYGVRLRITLLLVVTVVVSAILYITGHLKFTLYSIRLSFSPFAHYYWDIKYASWVIYSLGLAFLILLYCPPLAGGARRLLIGHRRLIATIILPLVVLIGILNLVTLPEMIFYFILVLTLMAMILYRYGLRIARLWQKLRRILFRASIIRLPLIVIGFLLIPLITLVVLNGYVYGRLPYVVDSVSQLFHARILLQGKFYLTSPPMPEFFTTGNVINNGRWYSHYPPGHILLLAIGELFKAAWLINPLFTALTVFLICRVGKILYGQRTGILAAILFMCSPYWLLMSSGMMNHVTTSFFLVLAFYCYLRAKDQRYHSWLLAFGLSLGMAFIIRPLTTVGSSFFLVIYDLTRASYNIRRWLTRSLFIMLGFAVMLAILLVFNWQTNGHPLKMAYTVADEQLHSIGFGGQAATRHTPEKGLFNCLNNIYMLSRWLYGWPVSSYILVIFLFLLGTRVSWDYLLLGMAAGLIIAYLFYPGQDFWYGPRFLYEAEAWLVLLTARGIEVVSKRLHEFFLHRISLSAIRRMVYLALLGLIIHGGFFAADILGRFRTDSLGGERGLLAVLKKAGNDPDTVVFVGGHYTHILLLQNMNYPRGPLYLCDLGVRNRQFIQAFPDKKYFILRQGELVRIE